MIQSYLVILRVQEITECRSLTSAYFSHNNEKQYTKNDHHDLTLTSIAF